MAALKTYIITVKYKNGEQGPFTAVWALRADNKENAKLAAEKEASTLTGTVIKLSIRKRDS